MRTITGIAGENPEALHYKVFTVKRQDLNCDPNMPAVPENLKWMVNTATLIYGEKDAVLVDMFMTVEQARSLVEAITATKLNLKYIYVTHSHGDHFFGLQMLLDRFPKAKPISTPAIAHDMAETGKPETLENNWDRLFSGQIPDRISFPQALEANSFNLEGYTIQVIDTEFTDTRHSTSIYVPCIGLLVAGDIVYDGIHPDMAETTKQTREEWIAALDELASLHPKVAVAGHKNPDHSDSPDNIAATKKYLADFERLNNETASAKELFDKMFALYSQHANPGSLWGAATRAKQQDQPPA
jgi:glyoxylase-like metal-dependent hydrolase (beta-lactamase superfamily II)